MLHNFARVSCKALFNLQEQEYYQLTVLSAVLTVLLGLKTRGQADSTIHDYEFYEWLQNLWYTDQLILTLIIRFGITLEKTGR